MNELIHATTNMEKVVTLQVRKPEWISYREEHRNPLPILVQCYVNLRQVVNYQRWERGTSAFRCPTSEGGSEPGRRPFRIQLRFQEADNPCIHCSDACCVSSVGGCLATVVGCTTGGPYDRSCNTDTTANSHRNFYMKQKQTNCIFIWLANAEIQSRVPHK